jgi:tRNA 2-selenouridine synthase
VEDESQSIGKNIIPPDIFQNLSKSPLLIIEMNKQLRALRLVQEYGNFSSQDLIYSILKIEKRLGGLTTKLAIKAVEEGRIEEAVNLCLMFYDKAYNFGLDNKLAREIMRFTTTSSNAVFNAGEIIRLLKTKTII